MKRIVATLRPRLEILERDDGKWNRREATPAQDLECVALHPGSPDRLFVGSFGEGVFRSQDGGRNFEHISGREMEKTVTSLAVDPSDPETIFVGTEPSRLYRSTDAGSSWSTVEGLTDVPSSTEWSFPPRPDTHHVRWVEIDPGDPERWYVGIEAGALVMTPDAGETWVDRPEGSQYDNHTLATHPDAPGRVYAAAGDGYAESLDGGESWDHPQQGLEHRYVWGLAVDPGDPDVRLVSAAHGASGAHRANAADSHVYRKTGDTPWEELTENGLPTGSGVLRPAFAPGTDPGRLIAASNHGVYQTADAGETWKELIRWHDRYGDQTVRDIVAC